MDAIDLSTVTILNSPDVRNWPSTAEITRITCTPQNTVFDFTKKDGPDAWPAQPFGNIEDHGNCQYTVWLFVRINGGWFGAGFIQMWQGRDGVGDAISDYVKNWMLPGRGWDPMVGHAIQVGELIGFMLTAGNDRAGEQTSVRERSNIVTIAAPSGDSGVFTFDAAPQPQPAPTPGPALPDEWEQLLTLGDGIVAALGATVDAVNALSTRLDDLKAHGLLVHM